MHAIIEESGGQRKVEVNDEILIDLIDEGQAKVGQSVTFDRVLLVSGKAEANIGKPYIAGASVTASVLEPVAQGEKIYVHKFQPKKAWKKKTGHRQKYTKVKVTAINA